MAAPSPSTLRDQLQAALGDAYRIERELAGGGMSRVFVATEVALGRPVVVKVLHPELAADVTAERFAREIQLAARLQQANIVPLLTAGHTGELPFYTMPFVEGLSLRQRLAEDGRLAIPEAIGILRDVARALAYAHDAGVAHRDIKPENVLLSGGAAVVTDFGIAKAITVARTQPAAATITQAGTGIGTPAYMAPEQAAGDPSVDHRADIYAFGCLAYELLAGHPPFQSSVTHELIAAHMTQRPAPVTSLRPEVPAALSSLIAQCLEKQPGQRPQSARELLDAIDSVATPGVTAGSGPVGSRRSIAVAAGAVIVVAALVYAISARRGGGATRAEPSLAVIPFTNVGGDSAQDYLADGVSDELATAIGKLPAVRLASRSSAYRFHGRRDLDIREVGKALAVRFVVQGTVRRVGDRLRISAQLNDATTGVELWSQSFDRTTKDVFRTQDEIATAVTGELTRRIGSQVGTTAAVGRGPSVGTADAEAYDLYLRGEFLLRKRVVGEAADFFQRAIARDSMFARAYAGLSQALELMPYYTSTPGPAVAERAAKAARFALSRDSTLAEAHMSIGMASMHAWRWPEARAAFERAVVADPTDVQTHFHFGRFYYYVGDTEHALAEWQRVKQLDPYSALAAGWSGIILWQRGQLQEALAETRRAIAYDATPAVISQLASRVYLAAGFPDSARQIADRMPRTPPWIGMIAYVHAMTGDREVARRIVRDLEAASPRPWFGNAALAYAYVGLGDTSRALTALEQATDAKEIWPNYNAVIDPMWNPVRKSARWAAVLHRVGLEATPGALP